MLNLHARRALPRCWMRDRQLHRRAARTWRADVRARTDHDDAGERRGSRAIAFDGFRATSNPCRFPIDASTARSRRSPSITGRACAPGFEEVFRVMRRGPLRYLHRRPRADEWLLAERIFSSRDGRIAQANAACCRIVTEQLEQAGFTDDRTGAVGSSATTFRIGFCTRESIGRKFISTPLCAQGFRSFAQGVCHAGRNRRRMHEAESGH